MPTFGWIFLDQYPMNVMKGPVEEKWHVVLYLMKGTLSDSPEKDVWLRRFEVLQGRMV